MTVTRPDGSVTHARRRRRARARRGRSRPRDRRASTSSAARSPPAASSEDVLSHFTIWAPPATGTERPCRRCRRTPSRSRPASCRAPTAARSLAWPPARSATRSSSRSRRSSRARCRRCPQDAIVVDVTAFLRSTHAPVTELGGVIDIRFPNASPGAHPVTSADGVDWRDIPQLPTLNLPDGQQDGWFRDSDGTVHVLARHLSYYALVGQEVSTKLAMRIMTVRAALAPATARSSRCAWR